MSTVKRALSEQTADEILKIINSEYRAGDKIPNEMELAKSLQVSRTTIREAIKLLCAINVVEIRRGNGTFVCGNPGMIKDPMGYRFLDKHKLVRDLYEMCLLFEPEIAALAAEKAIPVLLSKLKDASKNLAASIEDYNKGLIGIIQLIQSASDFHLAIAQCCDNNTLSRFEPLIIEGLLDSYYWNASLLTRYLSKYQDDLVAAIVNKQPDKAREYMRLHLNEGKQFFM
ncbi:DNA-binding transcriptional regulator, FadR family [Sporobacter termitidis DSM 10068]|uniref:DNA-binding transcriptional regulator, FadR family n=1 Tax=Sporobacter termitidis DSM 10068 TaxID=1123282 RepID=A0A1M5XUP3_9FIRM|nr:FadR/GntR family transcriptional regulator [Sporobacter termitidis]SHI02983.1 DNA-binding transcriptional regulator, FadR family [Sporobacter termitidis DSM 10068]